MWKSTTSPRNPFTEACAKVVCPWHLLHGFAVESPELECIPSVLGTHPLLYALSHSERQKCLQKPGVVMPWNLVPDHLRLHIHSCRMPQALLPFISWMGSLKKYKSTSYLNHILIRNNQKTFKNTIKKGDPQQLPLPLEPPMCLTVFFGPKVLKILSLAALDEPCALRGAAPRYPCVELPCHKATKGKITKGGQE